MKGAMRTALVGLAFLALAAAAGAQEAADEGLPDGLKGFSGQVRGVVKEKGDENVIRFMVGRLLRVWKGNKAENPELILGRTVAVGPAWRKGEDGQMHPWELHVAFLRKLEVGQELTLEIRHAEGDRFAILELSKEQREWAAGGEGGESDAAKLQARIAKLEEQLQQLQDENAELRRRLTLLEQRLPARRER